MSNEDVGAIVFDMDSPGGSVDGIPELAAEIRAARGEKPIVAIANAMMASAAYWLGSAADSISVSPSGAAGNIGVLAMHQDKSAAYEAEGVKTTMVKAGKFKGEGNEFEPLSPEAMAAVQSDVDYYYGLFTSDVAAGRSRPDQRVTSSDVANGYGEGRLLVAKRAIAANVADRIETLDQLVSRLVKSGPGAIRAGAFDVDRDSIRAGDAPGSGGGTLGQRLGLVADELGTVVTALRDRSQFRSRDGRGTSEATRAEMRKALELRAELDAIESILEADEHPPEDPPADDAPASARSIDVRVLDLAIAERSRLS
jgi:signal peptide peptidase SppA